jgi:hypothetical protein
MIRYLRSDATCLSFEDIQDIIKAKNSMKRASETMATKYKISTQRVYQIWRGVHPQIDPKDIKPFSKEHDSDQQADPIECNVISESKAKKTGGKKSKSKSALAELVSFSVQSQAIPTSHKKIAERNIKNIANIKNILEK